VKEEKASASERSWNLKVVEHMSKLKWDLWDEVVGG
jgi:hypothetical protein